MKMYIPDKCPVCGAHKTSWSAIHHTFDCGLMIFVRQKEDKSYNFHIFGDCEAKLMFLFANSENEMEME